MSAILPDAAAFAAVLAPGRALMGLDLGTRTIGVAVSDTSRRIASPLETIRRRSSATDAAALMALAAARADRRAGAGAAAQHGRQRRPALPVDAGLRAQSRALTELPITFWDERLSTVAAERALLEADTSRRRRAEVIDHVAAGYILQGLLDRLGHLARSAP